VKAIMAGMGYAVMGTATASGPHRAAEAATKAIASPLLEAGAIDGARGILINVTGSSSLKLAEVNAASMIIQEAAHEDANIIFGAVLDDKMQDSVKITVIATGFRDIPRFHQREQGTRFSSPIIVRDNPVRDTPRYEPDPEPEHVFHPEPTRIMSDADSSGAFQTVAVSEPHPQVHAFEAPAFEPTALEVPRYEQTAHEARYEQYDQHDLDVPAYLRKRTEIM